MESTKRSETRHNDQVSSKADLGFGHSQITERSFESSDYDLQECSNSKLPLKVLDFSYGGEADDDDETQRIMNYQSNLSDEIQKNGSHSPDFKSSFLGYGKGTSNIGLRTTYTHESEMNLCKEILAQNISRGNIGFKTTDTNESDLNLCNEIMIHNFGEAHRR